MSSLDSDLSNTTGDIEDLTHSMAVIRNHEIRVPRTARTRARADNASEIPEVDQNHDRFVDHTDSLEQIRSAQREIHSSGEVPGGGGAEGFPDPYYLPGP